MSEIPLLEAAGIEAPLLHLGHRPLGRGLVVRRTGEPRSVHVGEDMQRLHDVRTIARFGPDAGIDGVIDRFRRGGDEHRGGPGERQECGRES